MKDKPIKLVLDSGKIDLPMIEFSDEISEHVFNNQQIRKDMEYGSWDQFELDNIKEKLKLCLVKKCIHWDIARKYFKRDRIINLPHVILSAVLSTTLFTQVGEENVNISLAYSFAILSSILTVISVVNNYLNYSQLHTAHRNASLNYGLLQRNMEIILMKPPENRGSYWEVLERFMSEYSKIRENAPFIPLSLLNEYQQKDINSFNLDEISILNMIK